jgi:hypothetical protein
MPQMAVTAKKRPFANAAHTPRVSGSQEKLEKTT